MCLIKRAMLVQLQVLDQARESDSQHMHSYAEFPIWVISAIPTAFNAICMLMTPNSTSLFQNFLFPSSPSPLPDTSAWMQWYFQDGIFFHLGPQFWILIGTLSEAVISKSCQEYQLFDSPSQQFFKQHWKRGQGRCGEGDWARLGRLGLGGQWDQRWCCILNPKCLPMPYSPTPSNMDLHQRYHWYKSELPTEEADHGDLTLKRPPAARI